MKVKKIHEKTHKSAAALMTLKLPMVALKFMKIYSQSYNTSYLFYYKLMF